MTQPTFPDFTPDAGPPAPGGPDFGSPDNTPATPGNHGGSGNSGAPGGPGSPGPPPPAVTTGLDPPAEDRPDRRRLLALGGLAAVLVAGLAAYLVLFSGGDPAPDSVPVAAPAAPAPGEPAPGELAPVDPTQVDPADVLPLPGAVREDPLEVDSPDRGDDPFKPLVVEPVGSVALDGSGSTIPGGDDVVNPPADSSTVPDQGGTDPNGDDPTSDPASEFPSEFPSEEFPSEEFPSEDLPSEDFPTEEPSDPASVTEVPPSGDDSPGTPGDGQPVTITVRNINYKAERVAVTVDEATYRPRSGRRFASDFRFVGVDRDARRATFRYADVTLVLAEDAPLEVYGGNVMEDAPKK